jgi:hypothetical protein
MDGKTHLWIHNHVGAVYVSGFALGDFAADQSGDLAAHAQFSVAEGIIRNEDLDHTLSTVASTTGLEIFYLDGSNWRWTTNSGYSILNTGTGRMAYNSSGTQAEVTDNLYALCHIFAWNDSTLKSIAIQGQAQYTTLALARTGAQTEISSLILSGLPAAEMKPIGTVIFQTKSTYGNAVKSKVVTTDIGSNYIDWRRDDLSSATPGNDHGSLSGLNDDDHQQYVLVNGTRAMNLSRTASGAGDVAVASGTYLVAVNNTAAARAVTIPTAQLAAGRVLIIKDESGGAATHNITITPEAETIDGAASIVIDQNYGCVHIYSDGSNWFVLNKGVYA